MNLKQYADHRKALGLRGQTHVAVINACNDGRLTPPAVHRNGRSWIINAELADEQWATRTDPSEYGGMGGGTARPIGITTPAPQVPPEPAPKPAAAPPPVAELTAPIPKGGPSLAVSKQVKAAYEAKICELDFKQRNGELVVARDVKSQAFTLARAVRDGMMGIADRLAPQLAAATDPRQVHALLTTEIRVALRALADG
jgi:hypothetical protein